MLRFTIAAVLAVALIATAGPAGGGKPSVVVEHWGPSWSPRGDRLTFVRQTQTGSRITYATWLVKRDGTVLRRFPEVAQSAWSPDGRLLALVRAPYSDAEHLTARIYLTSRNGIGTRPLALGTRPVWAPSGTELAFTHVGGVGARQSPTTYVVRPNGTGLRRVAPSASASDAPLWSPDGRLIAFTARVPGTGAGLYVARRDGSELRRLVAADSGDLLDLPRPRGWSPDGTRLLAAVITSYRITIVRLDSGEEHLLGHGSAPRWSPDGSRIAFMQGCRLRIVPATGTITDDFPSCPQGSVGPPRWSPYGDRVIYHACFHDRCWVFSVGESTPPRNLGYGTQPAWSPTGQRIAYVKSVPRRTSMTPPRIHVMNANGTGVRPLLRREDSR